MLASLDDLAAIGGIPVDALSDSAEAQRATRLLELASGLVLTYMGRFGVTEDAVDGWEDFRRSALSAIVAEIAGKRLNVSAASSVDPYGMPVGPLTLKLNKWEKQSIRELLPNGIGGGNSSSIVVDRDFSWVTGMVDAPTFDVDDEES